MKTYTWVYDFKIENIITNEHLQSDNFKFNSPHYPSTQKNKNFTKGTLCITLNTLNSSVSEVVTEGLELIIALNNHVALPVNIQKKSSPSGLLLNLDCKINAHTTFELNNSNEIPNLWNKYQILLANEHPKLNYSISWFMKAVKSNNQINRFIYAWITFNILYGWLTDAPSDRHIKGIKGLLGKGFPNLKTINQIIIQHKQNLELISNMDLTDRNNINRSKNLTDNLVSNNSKKIIESAIEAIGFIRHSIFHGDINDRSDDADKCTFILLHLNSEIIKQQLYKLR